MPRRKRNARRELRRPIPRRVTGYAVAHVGRRRRDPLDPRPGWIVATGLWIQDTGRERKPDDSWT